MAAWTLSDGTSTRERLLGGAAMLRSPFGDGRRYAPDAIVVQGDRVAVQARTQGTFADGQAFA